MLLSSLARLATGCNTKSLLRVPRSVPAPLRFIGRDHNAEAARKHRIRTTLYYVTAAGVLTAGMSYAAVPLYRMFCQAYSYGGTTSQGHDAEKVETMQRVKDRIIKIRFNADLGAAMRWNFKPQQPEINESDAPIVMWHTLDWGLLSLGCSWRNGFGFLHGQESFRPTSDRNQYVQCSAVWSRCLFQQNSMLLLWRTAAESARRGICNVLLLVDWIWLMFGFCF